MPNGSANGKQAIASCIPISGPSTELKGDSEVPVGSTTSSSRVESSTVRAPSGPGFGIRVDPAFVRESIEVTTI